MSHPSPLPPTASAHYQVLRTVPSYDEAQRLVDRLSDAGFPVEHVRLVGTDLRLVEQVTGRMTYGKAALYGAASGAWLGLLIGLLGHAATGGRRDFSSVQGLEASSYEILVEAEYFEAATAKLDASRPTT